LFFGHQHDLIFARNRVNGARIGQQQYGQNGQLENEFNSYLLHVFGFFG
jgi:hypothetical protein